MKAIKTFLSVFLFCVLVLTVCADGLIPLTYNYNNPEVTVGFSAPLEVSAERHQEIADKLAGRTQNGIIDPSVSPDNIICTLFGHDLAPQATVTVTHHKVRQYNPRCFLELYHVTYCKRCDYTVEELHSNSYVICCLED